MNKQQIHGNLPWYVNGQLSAEQREEIEQQLKDDPALQQEVAYLERLRRQIKQSTQQTPGEFGLQKLKRDIRQQRTAPLLKRWKTLAVAASLLVVVQAGVMVSMLQPADTGMVPLSGSQYSGQVIQLQFTDGASAAQIRQLLASVNGSIIAGPSASGVYRVRLADSAEQGSFEQRIARLRAQTDVIDFVAAE